MACNGGYELSEDSTCEPIACVIGEGEACAQCKAREWAVDEWVRAPCPKFSACKHCSILNRALVLGSPSWWYGPGRPFGQAQQERTKANDCSLCNPGFFLTEAFQCEPYQCEVGPNAGCKACRGKENRTAQNQCEECNFGYELTENFKCKEGGSGAAKAWGSWGGKLGRRQGLAET